MEGDREGCGAGGKSVSRSTGRCIYDLTADLAFAQTHFPTSRITIYLNNLVSALHNEIYRNKREKWTRIITFWTQEVARTMHDARRELLTSFLIFCSQCINRCIISSE